MVDTNVVVVQAARPCVVSEALLAGYHTVFAKPGLRKQHGLTRAEIEAMLIAIARHAAAQRAIVPAGCCSHAAG